MSQSECPLCLRTFLETLSPSEKAELGHWILTTDDNAVTTAMILVIDPPRKRETANVR